MTADPASPSSPHSLRDRENEEPAERDPAGTGREVLLQGFNWDCHSIREGRQPAWLQILASHAAELSEDYDSLNTSYGSEADLRKCLKALQARGIKAIADIVINHRCAQQRGPDGKWNRYTGRYAWDRSAIVSNQAGQFGGTGAFKKEEIFAPAPNLDHSSERVRNDLKQWLGWLRRDVGFGGMRLDFSKGYCGAVVKEYVEAAAPDFCVGEFWSDCIYDSDGKLAYNQDAHRQGIVDWCDAGGGKSAAFDFTTKGVLQAALEADEFWRLRDGAGKPPGVMGWWPARAVTFIENHDTGGSQAHWPFPAAHLVQGYAYILTHPGTPCIFYDHLFADGARRPTGVWGSLKRLLSAGSGSLKVAPVHERRKGGRAQRQPLTWLLWTSSPLQHLVCLQSPLQLAPSASGSIGHAHSSSINSVYDKVSGSEAGSVAPSKASKTAMKRAKEAKAANSPQQLRDAIQLLIQTRRRARLHCRSQVNIVTADDSLYAATIDGQEAQVAIKIGPRSWSPEAVRLPLKGNVAAPWALACSGMEWAVWEQPMGGDSSRNVRSASLPIPVVKR